MQLDFSWEALIGQFVFIAFIVLMSVYQQRIQMWSWMRQIRAALFKLKRYSNKGQALTVKTVKELGKPELDPTERIKEFVEFVYIEPVSLDPAGVLKRLEHILDVRKSRYEDFVSRIAPKASSSEQANIENTIEAASALNTLYRIVRHFYILGKKTKNIYQVLQIQMILPMVMQFANAYYQALKAFTDGVPIGDGLGPLVVAKMVDNIQNNGGKISKVKEKLADDVAVWDGEYESRRVFFVRAEGPGGAVGKPGEAIKKLIEQHKSKIKRVVMVDAGLKLEGEKTGGVVEGVGAAIGDPGPEKYKIETSSETLQIPVDAIIVKESLEEAITPMRRSILESVEKVIKRIKRLLLEHTKEKDTIILAGIGNTIGIG